MGNSVWGMSICKYVVQLLVFVKTKLLETYPRFQENSNLAVLMNSAAVASASVRPSGLVRRALSQQRNGLSPFAPPSTNTAALQQARERASERATSEATKIANSAARLRTPTDGGGRRAGRREAEGEEEERVCRSEVGRIIFFPIFVESAGQAQNFW